MRSLPVMLLLFLVSNSMYGGGKFIIRPKQPTNVQASTRNGIEPARQINQLGGFFRLKEISPATQQVVETELVTFFIAKRNDRTISFSMNCARPVQLHYVLSDGRKKHRIHFEEATPYYRLEKEFDIARFNNGDCSIAVYTEQNELLHTIVFEKVASESELSN